MPLLLLRNCFQKIYKANEINNIKMGDTKQVKEFKELLEKARNHIKNKRFDDAIKLYMEIHNSFDKLPLIRKDELRKDVNLLYNELIVYMDANDAYLMAQEGNVKALKEKLEHIYELSLDLWNVKDANELLKYVEGKYEYCLNVYTYKISKNEFNEKYSEAMNLIHERKFDKAIKVYAQLLVYYNNLLKHEKNEEIKLELYNKMKGLYLNLTYKKTLAEAHSNKAELKKNGFTGRIEKFKLKDFKDNFSNIRKRIKEGNIEGVSI